MALLIVLTLVSLALVAIMITRQAEALVGGVVSGEHPHILLVVRREATLWWRLFLEWGILLSKKGSQMAALLLAKGSSWVSQKMGKLVARLHRHGRSE